MIIGFTKNNNFWSRALMYFCNEPFSHVIAILHPHEGHLYHATTGGVERLPFIKFFDRNKLVAAIKINSSICESFYFEKKLIKSITPHIGKPYDWPAYIFLGLCCIARKYTGMSLPKKNPFSTDRGFLCCEIFSPMSKLLLKHTSCNIDIDLAMTTPYQLYRYLIDRTNDHVEETNISELEKIIFKHL